MKKNGPIFLVTGSVFLALATLSVAQGIAALKLLKTIPLPAVHDGDFDHFAKDVEGHRLFLTAEANGTVEIFDSTSNKHVQSITGLKSPHALLYRSDANRLFVIDGDASQIKSMTARHFNLWDISLSPLTPTLSRMTRIRNTCMSSTEAARLRRLIRSLV